MRIHHRFAPSALAAVAIATLGYAVWTAPAPGLAEWIVIGGVLLAGLGSAAALLWSKVSARVGISCALLAGMLSFIVARLAGVKLFGVDPYHDTRYAAILGAMLLFTVFGVWRRWFVVRWLAMALSAAGIMSATLNLLPWAFERSAFNFALAIQISGALLILANLAGLQVRKEFESGASSLWASNEPMVRALRWTIVSQFAAIPMLLVYSLMQPIVPATSSCALALACFLSVTIVLTIRHKVVGAIGLVAGGTGLVILSAVTTRYAYKIDQAHGSVSLYYALFWVPAGLAAIVCGTFLAKPVVRLLRG